MEIDAGLTRSSPTSSAAVRDPASLVNRVTNTRDAIRDSPVWAIRSANRSTKPRTAPASRPAAAPGTSRAGAAPEGRRRRTRRPVASCAWSAR